MPDIQFPRYVTQADFCEIAKIDLYEAWLLIQTKKFPQLSAQMEQM
jgi:hypothetical protein